MQRQKLKQQPSDSDRVVLKSTSKVGTQQANGDIYTPDLDLLPRTLGYFLRLLQQAYKAHFLNSTPGLNLDPKHVGALFIVAKNPGISPTQFGLAMGTDGALTSLMLAMLERRGVLKREKSTADGRSRVITLTREGAALVAKLRRTLVSVDLHFTASLSPGEREQLLELMGRLLTANASGLTRKKK